MGPQTDTTVEPKPNDNVMTVWVEEASRFFITIPECSPPYNVDPQTTIALSLQHLFEKNPTVSDSTLKSEDSEWATVNLPSRDKTPASNIPTKLPSVQTLARPDILFASQAPYHIIVQITHNGISVQASHQPSLQLLKDYFEKYARVDWNDSNRVRLFSTMLSIPSCLPHPDSVPQSRAPRVTVWLRQPL